MKEFVFITGNQHKADYLRKWLKMPVEHHKLDLEEIQSLDLRAIAEHKARQAYAILQKPVLVEDVGLTFDAMGRLPGPLVKWFLEDMGVEGMCELANKLPHQKARAAIMYAYYDGADVVFFGNEVTGHIAPEPRGTHGFGWNSIFIPHTSGKTYAEMTDDEVRPHSVRAQIIEKLRAFLLTVD